MFKWSIGQSMLKALSREVIKAADGVGMTSCSSGRAWPIDQGSQI